MKQYYRTSKKAGTEIEVTYWHGDSTRADFLFSSHDFVLAIGRRKPKTIPPADIKEFQKGDYIWIMTQQWNILAT